MSVWVGKRSVFLLADKTRVKHARRVERSLRLVKCSSASEPCELVP